MNMINYYIIIRELMKEERDKTPNGFFRNDLTKEIGRLAVSIKYHINKEIGEK